ncbi:MAG: YcgN family cysteine cluster protein [Chloroflexi bacterium]|nr:YcgN family cysteine cluster protein [Chloroflexota bacterium]
MAKEQFWETKSLEELTPAEWESLCDGCARCCLYKLEDEEGYIYTTRVVCRYLDLEKCHCTAYETRSVVMPTCVTLDAEKVNTLGWLPPTCAYRLLAVGKGLPPWHPLVCGDPQEVHRVGVSVRNFAIPDDEVNMDKLEDFIFDGYESYGD